jgi:hypothetical protein
VINLRYLVALLVLVFVVFGTPAWAADAFVPGCSLPWQAIAKKRAIDETLELPRFGGG